MGCALKHNLEQVWREHFVLEDDLLEVSTTCITPEPVLLASGHVAKFEDMMVRDLKLGTPYRADKLILEVVEGRLEKDQKLTREQRARLVEISLQVENMAGEELHRAIAELGIKAPESGNDLSEPVPFNLMFKTNIGPSANCTGYLRPETAQGMFVNFHKLIEFNGGRMPMGVAQVGLGFRNEIAPRNGLLRVREFGLAEIEYFVDPLEKGHAKFGQVKGVQLPLWTCRAQSENLPLTPMAVGEAVAQGVIKNELVGYYLARICLFLREVGILPEGLRFRQHREKEMAHYAQDCWDAEICTSHGWVECVGCADRSAYDLEHHAKHSGQRLMAARKFKEAVPKEVVSIKVNKSALGKKYKKDGQAIIAFLEQATD